MEGAIIISGTRPDGEHLEIPLKDIQAHPQFDPHCSEFEFADRVLAKKTAKQIRKMFPSATTPPLAQDFEF